MDRVQRLTVFARVAELESFTQAAAQLGLPKATVSLAVRELEVAVGARLLHRTTRRVRLTEDGRAFHARSRDLLVDVDEVFGMFQRDESALTGTLRVDMPAGLARNLIVPALPAFLAEHPGLSLELSSTDRRVDLVREGFDCVLRVGALLDPSLIARSLGALRLVNCASPAYLARHGTPRRLEDLAKHRMIHYAAVLGQRPYGFEYHDGEAWRTVPVAGALTVNASEAYQAACLAGLGIIQVPLIGLAPLFASRRLVRILPRWEAEPMPVHLLHAERSLRSRRVTAFMQWLAAIVAKAGDGLVPPGGRLAHRVSGAR